MQHFRSSLATLITTKVLQCFPRKLFLIYGKTITCFHLLYISWRRVGCWISYSFSYMKAVQSTKFCQFLFTFVARRKPHSYVHKNTHTRIRSKFGPVNKTDWLSKTLTWFLLRKKYKNSEREFLNERYFAF